MKTYRIIADVSRGNRILAILSIHRPTFRYGRELGVVQAEDHQHAMDLARIGAYVQPEEMPGEAWK